MTQSHEPTEIQSHAGGMGKSTTDQRMQEEPSVLRPTFAHSEDTVFRSRAAAFLLNISETALRNYEKDSQIRVMRANELNPASPAYRLYTIKNLFDLAAWRRSQGMLKKLPDGPVVVSVAVSKGGTGKSTTTAELSTLLALEGYRVLCIDNDVQSNLTQLLGYESDLSPEDAPEFKVTQDAIIEKTFFDMIQAFLASAQRTVKDDVSRIIKKPFGENGVHLIPADIYLGNLEQILAIQSRRREYIYREFFEASMEGRINGFNAADYDFIFIDSPPSLNFSTANAIGAASVVLAPVKVDAFGVKGLNRLVKEMADQREENQGKGPELLVLPTYCVSNASLNNRMHNSIKHYQKALLNANGISASAAFPKSLENYLPLCLQDPSEKGVKEYRESAQLLIDRVLVTKPKKAVA